MYTISFPHPNPIPSQKEAHMFPHKAKPAVAAASRAPKNGLFIYNPHPTTTRAENQGFPGVYSPKTARKQLFYCKRVGLAICSLIGVLRSLFKAQVPVWGKMQAAIAPSILHRNSPPFYRAFSPQPSLSAGRDPPGQDRNLRPEPASTILSPAHPGYSCPNWACRMCDHASRGTPFKWLNPSEKEVDHGRFANPGMVASADRVGYRPARASIA